MQPSTQNPPNDYFLRDPKLNQRHIDSLPPLEAYLFFPKNEDVVEYNVKSPKKTLRRIFEGVTYLKYEEDKYKELLKAIGTYNIKNKKNPVILPPDWKEGESRRFLQATGYDSDKTIELIITNIEWRKKYFPIQITNKSIELLNCGFIYIHGRDNHLRPVFVVQAKKYMDLKDKYTYEDWLLCIIYFMEYLVNELLIPGQVENWVLISDVTGVSMVFPPGDMKKLIAVLQSNYRCRLYVNYVIGMSGGLQFLWNLIKGFLDKTTVKKVRFLEKYNMHEILTYINEEQVEKKFKGTAENIPLGPHCYFPPNMPSRNFFKKEDDREKILISEEMYKRKVEEGSVFCKSMKLVEKWENEKNMQEQILWMKEENEKLEKMEKETKLQIFDNSHTPDNPEIGVKPPPNIKKRNSFDEGEFNFDWKQVDSNNRNTIKSMFYNHKIFNIEIPGTVKIKDHLIKKDLLSNNSPDLKFKNSIFSENGEQIKYPGKNYIL
jgi:hypothetical protein